MTPGFVHLHLHTQYSLLDGGIHLSRLFPRAKELGFQSLAITDHGNMFGAVDFYKRAKAAGIHPIIGCETYVAPKSRLEKSSHRGLSDAAYHLVLLVRDETGYKNLVKLTSAAYLEGFYYKPRIDRELLAQHSEGLIGLSACLKGEIAWLVRHNNYDKAKRRAQEYARIFGEGNFYIELQKNGLEEQEEVNTHLVSIANEVGLPLVATNDCHYLDPEDAEAHDVLLCIQTGKHVEDTDRMRMSTNQLYLRSPAEVAELFEGLDEAVKNTVEIANRCNFEFKMHQYKLPRYKVPSGYTLHGYLEELAINGLESRREAGELDPAIPFGEYRDRLSKELAIINEMGFSGYFLIVWEFIDYAKRNGIPVGPGRGSAAGSLVSYSLGITSIDPLRYHLLFERFLNPERVSMPDIDVDICMNRRDEVVEHVRRLYGEENVAKIITFGTLSARAVVRDVGRALNLPYGEVDTIAKLIPPTLSITIKEALRQQPRLRELMDQRPEVKRLIEIAQKLEGLYRHASTHAAGVVITPDPLTEYLPLYRASDKNSNDVVTQYAKDEVEELGLLKMDLLGLKTLTILDMAVRLAERYKDVERIDLDHLPLDDEKTFNLLCTGQTTGVFQLESSGMRELIKKMQPSRFEDIIALVALYRPGPLESGMVDDYINRRHGRVEVSYPLPQLEPILKETYGIILYQEQVMQIAVTLGGYSMGQADLLRKAMGKKKPELMQKERSRFVDGALKNGVPKEKAEEIFNLMEKFAGYGFNKSHSAAYAMIAYQTAYMKAHHPVAFMAALISGDMANTDKIYKYIKECAEMGIEVLPPDINDSDVTFSVKGNSLRFGLAAIKNVGEAAVESIVSERRAKGPFKSLYDFCRRVDLHKVNRKALESLIKAGAFDSTGKERHVLLGALEKAMEEGNRRNKAGRRGQVSLFEMAGGDASPMPEWYPQVPPLSQKELLEMDKEALGFYVTSHPMEMYAEKAREVTELTIERVHQMQDGTEVVICGVVAKKKELSTKKKERMAIVQLEDTSASVEVVVFPSLYREVELPLSVSEEPFVVRGRVDSDSASEGTNKVLAEEMMPLGEAMGRLHFEALPSSLSFVVDLDMWEGNGDLVVRLFDMASVCRGNVPLRLVFERKGDYRAVIEALKDFWVNPGLLEKEFNRFASEEAGLEGVRLLKEN